MAQRSYVEWRGDGQPGNYRKVRYRQVWAGIDVAYYGTGRELEYDIIVQPGADPRDIRLRMSGMESLSGNAAGDLVMKTALGDIVQRRPNVYQEIGGCKVSIAGRYRIGSGGRVSFGVARYDRTKALVIDPVLAYYSANLQIMGENSAQLGFYSLGVAADRLGNAYITGVAYPDGAYLLKLDPNGNIAGTFNVAGGGGKTQGIAVAVDSEGYIYVAGATSDSGLTGTSGYGFQSSLANGPGSINDGFLIAYWPSFPAGPGAGNNNPVRYITYMGGSGADQAIGVAALNPSAVYVAGTTSSPDFPISLGQSYGSGAVSNAFLVKVDTTQQTGPGSKLWARYIGGQGDDSASGAGVDALGNAYVVGTTTSFSSGFSPYPASSSGLGFNAVKSTANLDGYMEKIDPTGASSLFLTYFSDGRATSVAVRGSTAYVTGASSGKLGNVSANAAQPTFGGGAADAFLFRVDTSQSGEDSLIYSSYLGGPGTDEGLGVAADDFGRAYITGIGGGGFPAKNALQPTFSGGASNPFYAVMNTRVWGGDSLMSSTYLGSSPGVLADGIALAPSGRATVSSIGGAVWGIANAGYGSSDFDGNGVPDLVWLNDATRQVTVNYFGGAGGATYLGWNYLNEGGVPGWHVVAVADFNGDGVPDLVWQNDTTAKVTVNYYGGATGAAYVGWNWLDIKGEPGWQVVGAADFNGDGVPDLVWMNSGTRQVTVNYFGGAGGATYLGWNYLNQGGVPGWHVVAVADFNGDGVPDLVWQNDSTAQVAVDYYGEAGGATFTGWNWLNQAGEPGWQVVGAGDFNGDGAPDLIWMSSGTRQVTVNYYGGAGGATYLGWNYLIQGGDPGWTVVNR